MSKPLEPYVPREFPTADVERLKAVLREELNIIAALLNALIDKYNQDLGA
jgi:hypothetical protein